MRTKIVLLISITLLILMGTILAACSSNAKPTATTPSNQPPAATTKAPTTAPTGGDGEKLLNERCTKCHSLDRVKTAQKTQDQWQQIVTRMVGKGANLSNDEQKTLVEYLAKTYGP